jgi:fibronectin type 3 domain-containing protein
MTKPRIAFLLVILLLLAMAIWERTKRDTGHHHVTLTWQAPSAAPKVSITGYNVYRRLTPGERYSLVANGVSVPHYEDRLVQSGKTYFYVVTSLDSAGQESRFSREIAATVP